MNVYVLARDAAARQRKSEEDARGRLAMFRLLLEQRRYAGLAADEVLAEVGRAEADLVAVTSAPPGTALLTRSDRGVGQIWVVREDRSTLYAGPADGYAKALGAVAS